MKGCYSYFCVLQIRRKEVDHVSRPSQSGVSGIASLKFISGWLVLTSK